MTLLLFDIDGTLTATAGSDVKCYPQAFERTFGFPLPSCDWHDYTHATDRCIVNESLEQHRGAAATLEELARFEQVLLDVQQAEHRAHPEDITEIPGACRIIERIARENGYQTGVATGGMRASALFKLAQIGIDAEDLPGGFANDALARADILKCAIRRAGVSPDDVIYLGDALWDVQTCAALSMRFVGITYESSEARLRAAGATQCLHSYEDQAAFLSAVREATPPCPTAGPVGAG